MGTIQPRGSLDVRHPTLTSQNNMHAPIAVAHARLSKLFDALLRNSLAKPVRFVVVGRGVRRQII